MGELQTDNANLEDICITAEDVLNILKQTKVSPGRYQIYLRTLLKARE